MQKQISAKLLVVLSTIFSTLLLAGSASGDTIDLMWDRHPESQVIGYVVHVGTQSGTYTQHIDVGSMTAWSFTSAVAGRQYCFTVTAYVSGPLEGPPSNEACGWGNAPPALTNPGTQSSKVGQPASLQLGGSDPKGDVLTYSATGLPPGLTLMASTGYVSGTPTTSGSYSVTARVSDGTLTASQTFTWTTGVVDTAAPVVTISSPTSAATYSTAAATVSLSGTASDSVGVTQVTWVNNRGGSGTASGATSWIVPSLALQAGSNLLTVTARDAAGNTASDVLTVTVNAAPTLASVANQSSTLGLATTLQLSGSDSNGDALTYSATGLPNGLAVAPGTGLIRGTPTTAGTFNVSSRVSDGSLTASRAFTWTITASDTTSPAVTITSPTTAAAFKTGTATITLGGTAADNVGVTQVSWSNNRGGSGSAAGKTSWSASVALQTGANMLTVTARDAAGNTKTASITVTLNTPPTLATVANRTAAQGKPTSLQLSGADADRDVLTYGGNGLPTGMAIGVSTGLISGTPVTAGSYPVTVTVSDGMQTATRTFTWSVANPVAPVVRITTPTTATTFSASAAALSLGGTASDNVGVRQVTWSNSLGGSGTATGTTNWSASIGLRKGLNLLTITARDADGNLATDRIAVSYGVADTSKPVISITNPETATRTSTATSLAVSGTAWDNVGVTQITWRNSLGGDGLATGTASWSAKVTLRVGVNVITFTARDAIGNTTTKSITVTKP